LYCLGAPEIVQLGIEGGENKSNSIVLYRKREKKSFHGPWGTFLGGVKGERGPVLDDRNSSIPKGRNKLECQKGENEQRYLGGEIKAIVSTMLWGVIGAQMDCPEKFGHCLAAVVIS